MCYKDVMRELGYPSDKALRNWYAEYKKNGNLHPDCTPCKCQCQNVFFLESQNVQLLEFNVQKI